ncbi:hypothetical protein [Colwellia psychrerythraea]|uniref:Uncharacterized protein n=1 Tax=Colwellia psychrerythraea TaxID=28229 RepID=A0A099KJH4_COLPS|nr:hypothetical protein [Colwellia psychrerythraea]KGJ90410.1 hypothetical protein GAB14E_3653 [Colwellia psychrerythraea]
MHAMLSTDLNLNLGQNSGREAGRKSGDVTEPKRLSIINRKDTMPCKQVHLRQVDEDLLENLVGPQLQVKGAIKCCQCAYNSGYQQGLLLQKFISLDLESLGDSHANADGSHKSVHQAFALGYSDGVDACIKN